MSRLTCFVCCLFLIPGVVLGLFGTCVLAEQVKQPILKLRVSNANHERIVPSKSDDDSLLRKMLPLREHKHLKLRSELEGLADRGVSQPWMGVS